MNGFRFASPQTFYPLAGRIARGCAIAAAVLGFIGLYIGFILAPTDAQQGEAYRIIFVHVPAAWMSMVVYLAMAFWAAVGLVFNARLAAMMARARKLPTRVTPLLSASSRFHSSRRLRPTWIRRSRRLLASTPRSTACATTVASRLASFVCKKLTHTRLSALSARNSPTAVSSRHVGFTYVVA